MLINCSRRKSEAIILKARVFNAKIFPCPVLFKNTLCFLVTFPDFSSECFGDLNCSQSKIKVIAKVKPIVTDLVSKREA